MNKNFTKMILGSMCVIALQLCSCNNSNTTEQEITQIELGEVIQEPQEYSDLFEVVSLIPLDNKETCMFSEITKMKATPKGFLFMGRVKSSDQFPLLFDKDGKFITKVGDYGHGKGEYQYIWDATPSESCDKVIVSLFDRVNIYDSQGKFIKSKELFKYSQIHSIISCPSGYVCSTDYSEPNYSIHFLDNDLNVTDELLPTNSKPLNYPFFALNSIRIFDDKLYYYDGYKTMFSVIDLNNHSIVNQVAIKGENTATIEKVTDPQNSKTDVLFDTFCSFYVYNNLIKGTMMYNRHFPNFDLDLNTDSIKVYTCYEYTPTIYDYDGEYYYDIISPSKLLKIVKGFYLVSPKTKSMFQKAYAQLASEVSELDNYVVVKLKKVK